MVQCCTLDEGCYNQILQTIAPWVREAELLHCHNLAFSQALVAAYYAAHRPGSGLAEVVCRAGLAIYLLLEGMGSPTPPSWLMAEKSEKSEKWGKNHPKKFCFKES
jgi:hypothetical protein